MAKTTPKFQWKYAIIALWFGMIALYCYNSSERIAAFASTAHIPNNMLGDVFIVFSITLILYKCLTWLSGKCSASIQFIGLFALSFIPVLLYLFWSDPRHQWELNTQISFMEAIIALISLLIVFWGGYIAVRQLKISAEANRTAAQTAKLSSFRHMVDILQKENARERRKRIYQLYDEEKHRLKIPREQWTDENCKDIHDALTDLDLIGLMVKYELLDEKFLEGWDYSIYNVLNIARPLKEEEETRYSSPMGSNYYLGVNELIKRKNIIFDCDNIQSSDKTSNDTESGNTK